MMKNKIILSFVLSILLFAVGVSATVGVTSFYYDKNPLIVNPGETKEISFGLQNHGGDADATVKVELADGFNIAEFTDENLEYFIELDGDDVSVPLTIKIPEDAQPGQEWSVGASFSRGIQAAGGSGTSSRSPNRRRKSSTHFIAFVDWPFRCFGSFGVSS